jgi:hypothetical protein
MSIATHDVVFRYLRFRAGPSDLRELFVSILQFFYYYFNLRLLASCCRDALVLYGATNVVLDHITASWVRETKKERERLLCLKSMFEINCFRFF